MESMSKLSTKIFNLDKGGNLQSGRGRERDIRELAPQPLTTHPGCPPSPPTHTPRPAWGNGLFLSLSAGALGGAELQV